MNRLLVPGVPILVSLALSLSTVGRHAYWQDSGFYLTAVHDLGVLYPHGFVLYQLLCKVWTIVFFFLDFTLAVHLFSSVCAALAAGTIALAVRDFLSSRSSLWKVAGEEAGPVDVAGIVTGCLAAAGYTFWFSGIYAKGYALLYLVLALLLLALIRCCDRRAPGDFTRVAVLSGLAWAVHPSAVLGGPALVLFMIREARSLGALGIGWRFALGTAVALGPTLALPLLSLRDVETSFGRPQSLSEVAAYVLGSRYVGVPGMFGYDSRRVAALGSFFLEEFLGIGLALIAVGLVRMIRVNRPLLLGWACWTLPYLGVATAFKIEGQNDLWYVAASFPLFLALGLGLQVVGTWAGKRALPLQLALAGLAFAWALVANGSDLSQRRYELAETFGRLYLQNLEPNAILFAQSDDVLALCWYLQSVKRQRQDVLLVNAAHLGSESEGRPGWYEDCLKRRHPELRMPPSPPSTVAAILSANAEGGRPLYTTVRLSSSQAPRGFALVPQGAVWKLMRAEDARIDPAHFRVPIQAEDVPALFRRKRGITVTPTPKGFEVEFQAYEARLLKTLLKTRYILAEWQVAHARPSEAIALYETILPLDPSARRNEWVVHYMGLSYLAVGKAEQAESFLKIAVEIGQHPWVRAGSWLGLGDLYRQRGDAARARQCYLEATRIRGLTEAQERAVRERLSGG